MPTQSNLINVVGKLRPGMVTFIPGISGESLGLFNALQKYPEVCRGVKFVGTLFPGINKIDYLGLHPEAKQRNYFMLPGLRNGFSDGRGELLPLDYPGIFKDLKYNVNIDISFAQVSAPDEDGYCSLGLCQDFIPAVWGKSKIKVLHINPSIPHTNGSFKIRFDEANFWCEEASDLVVYESENPDENQRKIASNVNEIINDGDVLELGIGKLPSAIIEGLTDHRDLKIFSGLVTDSIIKLLDSGAVAGKGAIRTGAALGGYEFYKRIGEDDSFYFHPVSESHDIRVLASIENFTAINSAVEVDLLGQVNADSIRGKQVAGVGGLPAFVSGSRLSEGGKSVIVMPAMTDNMKYSRIVPLLSEACWAGIPRHDADFVVTEYGVARLRGLAVHQRAKALISIAHPSQRERLSAAWQEINARF